MLDRLLSKSLAELQRTKRDLAKRIRRQATTERRIVERLGRALARVGYRIVPLAVASTDRIQPAQSGRRRRRLLHCPKCDRRFSHRLPMSRHIAAMHKPAAPKKPVKPPASSRTTPKHRRRARKTGKKTTG